jgi:hypothetical protein
MYLQQDNQHAGQPDRNALLLLRCAYRFLTLSLMVNAPPCPPISVQSHTGKTTREVMSERPDHRDGDALVHELHQGAMYGRQVCYNISLVPYIYTFLPCCPAARPSAAPKHTTHHHFIRSRCTHHPTLQVTFADPSGSPWSLHICKKGTTLPYWSPHYAICNTPRTFCTFPRLRVPPTRTHAT